ncbi:hypothetical protein BDM02DRAFT_3203613 [Thelephora ganbajun]|uniref:Uncharacterized protein n=1 Tax=Thelephora ganbajun TaxID=370292 RepID=A0ACB6Z7D5_THEGA|nr:hypothetical protein BDM02DRAFT_3203613 [Thelephora ganbajun]
MQAFNVHSPAVVIFKGDLDHSCVDLLVDQRQLPSSPSRPLDFPKSWMADS